VRHLIATVVVLSAVPAQATVAVINVNLETPIEAPRWMYDSKVKPKGGPLVQDLIQAKKALLAKDRASCLAAVQKAYTLGKSLGPWIAWNQSQCAQLRDKSGNLSVSAIKTAMERLESEPRWLLSGPAAQLLRISYTSGMLLLAEQQVKTDRRAAWKTLDKLQQVRNWLSVDERATAYRFAGELAFIEQNLTAAQDFLLRSLNEKESAELRTRVESIRSSLLGGKKKDASASTGTALPKVADDLGVSDEERDIYARMTRSYESQDYISAIEDAMDLIQKFPGGKRAGEASDRVLDIYLSLANRTEDKFRHVRERTVKEMAKADPARLSRWANNAYAKGSYLDALNLAEKAYEKYNGHPDSTKMALLAGEAAQAAGEYDEAVDHFERLVRQHAGTQEAAEATFRLGLLEYRKKRYSQAAAYFERLLALSQGKDWEYRALYWQWRSQQKIDSNKATPYAQQLASKFPLTYYGLRAQAELNGGEVQLPKGKATANKIDLRLLQSEQLGWERLGLLLKAGWFREAEKEIEFLPEANTNEERLLRAKLWAGAMRYDLAMQALNKALEENQDYIKPDVLRVIYPLDYTSWITRESKTMGLQEDWVRSLIRQESSFRPEAKSPANAFGVMQLLPTTAQELAREFKLKDFSTPDSLLNPEINIKLGTTYLSRLIRSFGGNVPLALAAYNAGPTRLRRWLNARKDLSGLESSQSSSPEVEVWIDEIPWDETSFYVKAILRNWMVYRLLDGSKLSLSEPIWVDAKTASR
jgi:soluble lytic murein transglycosylase